MAQLVVRNLDAEIKKQLALRARRHGHSMEEEVRTILREAVAREAKSAPAIGLGTQLAACFDVIGLEEPLPELKGQKPRPATFE